MSHQQPAEQTSITNLGTKAQVYHQAESERGGKLPGWHRRDAVISRLRLRGHDYSLPGDYFVTLCTEQRLCLFDEVHEGQMMYSPAGLVIESWWLSIPRQFPKATLDAFVVMPNHLHGIVTIESPPEPSEDTPRPKLSDIIHWFKVWTVNDYGVGVRDEGWPRYPGRLWQERFYEHIIRSEVGLDRIRSYIESNPGQWPWDGNNPDRTSR